MIKKISKKDQKDWKNFLDSRETIENKDITIEENKNIDCRSIDLHGLTLENANEIISNFISECYLNNINNIKVITGKGSRSKNKEDPYLSIDLSILKYSVPDYIKNNFELMKKIKKLDLDSVNDINKGSFDIVLKKNYKINLERSVSLTISPRLFLTYFASIFIFSPPLSVAVKLISSRTLSIIVCSLLAPIFSTFEFTS